MGAVFQHIGLVLLYILFLLLNLLIFVGLPGSWAMFAGIIIYVLSAGLSSIGWVYLIVMAALLIIGEIAEAALGVVAAAGKGATKWGIIGTFLGGIAGAIIGTAIIPVAGSVIFALVGAFSGAVICEYLYYNSLDQALRIGFFAFIGKLLSIFVKVALGLIVLGLFIYKSWP